MTKIYLGTNEPGTSEIQMVYALDREDYNVGLLAFNCSTKQWERHDELIDDILPGGDNVYKLLPDEVIRLVESFGGSGLPE